MCCRGYATLAQPRRFASDRNGDIVLPILRDVITRTRRRCKGTACVPSLRGLDRLVVSLIHFDETTRAQRMLCALVVRSWIPWCIASGLPQLILGFAPLPITRRG